MLRQIAIGTQGSMAQFGQPQPVYVQGYGFVPPSQVRACAAGASPACQRAGPAAPALCHAALEARPAVLGQRQLGLPLHKGCALQAHLCCSLPRRCTALRIPSRHPCCARRPPAPSRPPCPTCAPAPPAATSPPTRWPRCSREARRRPAPACRRPTARGPPSPRSRRARPMVSAVAWLARVNCCVCTRRHGNITARTLCFACLPACPPTQGALLTPCCRLSAPPAPQTPSSPSC